MILAFTRCPSARCLCYTERIAKMTAGCLMNKLRWSFALSLAALTALATTPILQEFPPDLAIESADEWSFEEEGRALVLIVEVANYGGISSPETVVRVFAWEPFDAGVPPVPPQEIVRVEVFMPIPPERAGTTQEFELVVDPDDQVDDAGRENNVYATPPIELPGQPEEPETGLFIENVSPPEIFRGEGFTLEIFGGGFEPETEVAIEGVGIEGISFENETHLIVDGFVPEDAGPGPRRVEVFNPDGRTAAFEEGVVVVGEEIVEPPVEPPIEEPTPPRSLLLILIGGAVVLALGVGALTLVVRTAARSGRKSLQEQAQKQDPPDQCTPGGRWVKEIELGVQPGRWLVDELRVTLYESASGTVGSRYQAPRNLLNEINDAIRARRRPGDQATLPHVTLSLAGEFAATVVGWQALEQQGRDVSLDAKLAGGEAEVKFEVYRCKGQPPNTQWVKEREWTAKVKATDRHAGTVRGPVSGEPHDAYVARTRNDIEARLRELVDAVAQM